MLEIIPAILPKKFGQPARPDGSGERSCALGADRRLRRQICAEQKLAICEGWNGGVCAHQSRGRRFPFLGFLDFEIDLMVKDPEEPAHDWVMAGPNAWFCMWKARRIF